MKVSTATTEELDAVASFIADLNKNAENHIGFCGKQTKEILNSLQENLTDIPFPDSFVTAYKNGELIGVLGFDADVDNHSAEIWGPFVLPNLPNLSRLLWDEMLAILPPETEKLDMFPNKQNSEAIKFALDHKFSLQSEQAILHFHRDNFLFKNLHVPQELPSKFFSEMRVLHDLNFPHTYYSGKQILDRLNHTQKVFVHTENNELVGYIYVETEPQFGEANIEFFAVKESHRGQGLGVKLLHDALNWIFTFENIQSIQLCVNATNDKAIMLYKKVGFSLDSELIYLVKEMRG